MSLENKIQRFVKWLPKEPILNWEEPFTVNSIEKTVPFYEFEEQDEDYGISLEIEFNDKYEGSEVYGFKLLVNDEVHNISLDNYIKIKSKIKQQ